MKINGTHRIKTLKNGKRVETGSYIIQFQTRFSHCKRLQLTTSVYPVTRNAATIIAEMKLMLKEMNRSAHSVERFMQMRDKKLKLFDVYEAWKQGTVHLLSGNESKMLLPELEQYRTSGVHTERVAKINKAWLATFHKKEFMSDSSRIADLPSIVQKALTYYSANKKHTMFNLARMFFLGFVRKHCGHSKQSVLYQAIQRLEPLKITRLKEHHPFESPRDVDALIEKINDKPRTSADKKQMYKDAIQMLAFHPFRPTEFFELKWERDTLTGHLRIKGTKTANAIRVVPMLLFPTHYKVSKLGTYRLTDKALNEVIEPTNILSRSRDFRRSWAIWAEKANIPRSRIIAYMGHAGKSITDLYQKRAITRAELDEDCKNLQTFIANERAISTQSKIASHYAPRTL
ncbi:MAG: hypothetical protein NTX19_10910 [Gemmatimonadetes bacterium]|nr:hypothetical protein [Gemmatimonadota bacterium]